MRFRAWRARVLYLRSVNTIAFEKYEGLGNDFLVVLREGAVLDRDVVRALCDRHRGVGGDGVLLVSKTLDALRMEVLNADGSRPEMCGNGLRCVVLDVVRRGWARANEAFVIETDAGPHRVHLHADSDASLDAGDVEIEMRAPSFTASEVPFVSPSEASTMRDEAFVCGEQTLRFSAASMGNPHVVTFDALSDEEARKWGPFMEAHPRFPEHANAGFASIVNAREMNLRVYERGVGWTEACGTGACAAAALAVETGRMPRHVPLRVNLPGGPLVITVREPGERVRMRGPATHVFSGSTRFTHAR